MTHERDRIKVNFRLEFSNGSFVLPYAPKGVTFDNFRGEQSFNLGCLPLFSKGGET